MRAGAEQGAHRLAVLDAAALREPHGFSEAQALDGEHLVGLERLVRRLEALGEEEVQPLVGEPGAREDEAERGDLCRAQPGLLLELTTRAALRRFTGVELSRRRLEQPARGVAILANED